MISRLPLPTRPQLGHHDIEDGDQDDSICSQQEQYRPYVDSLKAGMLKERTFSFDALKILSCYGEFKIMGARGE